MEKFPLQWPAGYKRTRNRIKSKFSVTMERAQNFLQVEIKRLNATGLIVSTNIPVRNDGLLYTDWMRKKIDDPGVAIYFKYKDKPVAMCCDQYNTVWENIYALGKGIEALRGMERWGVSDFLDKAFTGFAAIPEKTGSKKWFQVLEVTEYASQEEIRAAYFAKAKTTHPDTGGSDEAFSLVLAAYNEGTNNNI